MNGLLHSMILMAILTVAFAFIISRVEKDAITNQVRTNIRAQMRAALETQRAKDPKQFCSAMGALNTPVPGTSQSVLDTMEKAYSRPYEANVVQNSWVRLMSIALIVALGAAVLVGWIFMTLSGSICGMMVELLVENLIVFLCIAGIEIGFFMLFARKYVPVSPSFMKNEIMNQLRSIEQ